MVIRKDTHYILDLTESEVALLTDLLRDVRPQAQARGDAWEGLRMDLLDNLCRDD